MENIIKLITGITGFVVAIFTIYKYYNDNFTEKRLKKLKALKDLDVLYNKLDNRFRHDVMNVEIKEQLFYFSSGIRTSNNLIDLYIELKKRIGGNCTLSKLSYIQNYIKLENDELIIRVNKFWFLINKIISLIGLIICLFVIVFLTIKAINVNITADILLKKSILFIVGKIAEILIIFISGIFMIYMAQPVITAKKYQSQLGIE